MATIRTMYDKLLDSVNPTDMEIGSMVRVNSITGECTAVPENESTKVAEEIARRWKWDATFKLLYKLRPDLQIWRNER